MLPAMFLADALEQDLRALQQRYLLSFSPKKRAQLREARTRARLVLLAKAKLESVKGQFPRCHVKVLSDGSYLLTDRASGKTVRELSVLELG